jgi:DNA processing protein
MKRAEILLALWLVPGLGPRKIRAVCDHFPELTEILHVPVREIARIQGINHDLASAIVDIFDSDTLAAELRLIEQSEVKLLDLADPNYSNALLEIHSPPPVLYLKGEIDLNAGVYIGFVGSRKASYAGKNFCQQIIKDLARYLPNAVVVSGLAFGIDTIAHHAALENKLKTVAVLGSGLNQIYPRQNQALSRSIMQQGAVISEFPLMTKPNATNFPLRNRIISGLSKGILVVEAGERSGALITAGYALEQNRELFAMPGLPGSKFYVGNNRLIQQGHAKLILRVEDILEEITLQQELRPISTAERTEENHPATNEYEKKIIAVLQEGELSQDILCQRLELPLPQLLATLTTLEMKEIILSKPGHIYQIVPSL